MTRRTAIRAFGAAAVVVAVLVVVLTQGGHTDKVRTYNATTGPTVLGVASGYLRVPAPELRSRLRSGQTLAQIAAATKGASRTGLLDAAYAAKSRLIKARHLPPAAERAELALLRSQLTGQIDLPRLRRRVPAAARHYLRISEAELSAQLAAGRTLGAIAATRPGRSRSGLIEVLVAGRVRALQQALRERRLTAAAERRAAARVRARSVHLVDRLGG